MWMKVDYLKMSCLTNCHKMLNFVNFENGATTIQRGIMHMLLNRLPIPCLSRIDDMSGYFEIQKTVVFLFKVLRTIDKM